MKILKLGIIGILGIGLVGCSNNSSKSQQNDSVSTQSSSMSEKPSAIAEFTELSEAEQQNVDFDFEARAVITEKNNIEDNWPPVAIDVEIENETNQPVKVNLGNLRIQGLNQKPNTTETITLQPNEEKKIRDVFTNLKNFDVEKGKSFTCHNSNRLLDRIDGLDNWHECKSWIRQQKKSYHGRHGVHSSATVLSGATEDDD